MKHLLASKPSEMGPSSIEMVIKAPETVIWQFIGVAVVSERSRAQWCPGGLFQIGGVLRVQINDYGLSDVIIILVLHNDHKGLILTTNDPSEPNIGLKHIFCTIRATQDCNLTSSEPLIAISIIIIFILQNVGF